MRPVTLAEGVYWVGAVDWTIRDFHGYFTYHGTTYNAYLILDHKIALIDTVKSSFGDEMLQRIREIINPADIDFVICNHVEPDHAGTLPLVLREARKATVITSEKFGEAGLARTFHPSWSPVPVKEGSELELGRHRLKFIPIPMLHWPDSMATYLADEAILFPNDLFGQHHASSERFDDEVNLAEIMAEAAKYYANIFMPFGSLVQKALDKFQGWEIKLIAPSHGIIWRSHLSEIMQAYAPWAKGEARAKAVVIYDTMWGSTEKMAKAVIEGMAYDGVEAKLHKLTQTHMSDIVHDVLEAKALIIGSSTQNNSLLPSVAAFLQCLRGLKPKGKLGAAFGSYGWGGGAKKAIEQELKQMGLEVLDSGLEVRFVPDTEEIERCVDFGKTIAQKVK